MTRSRSHRLRALAALLRDQEVASQEEARELLHGVGFPVTQATLSRDLDRLGAVKAKRDGRLVYMLPDQVTSGDWSSDRLRRVLTEWAISIEAAGQLIVIRTPPGSAQIVASAMDHARWPEIAGTVSGDDTLFIAVRDGIPIPMLLRRLGELAGEVETRQI